jgi:xanthine dehydrogenase YagS FAD-binding subunit
MRSFTYIKPQSVEEAVTRFRNNDKARYIAGATNLLDLMKKDIEQPECLVDISRLPMKEVKETGNGLQIGAGALNSVVAEHPLVQQRFSLVGKALLAGASPQLRNMATIGGNLLQRTRCPYFYDTALPCNKRIPGSGCGAKEGLNRGAAIFGASEQCVAVHPSDLCVALAALDAQVLTHDGSYMNTIPFADFHRLPGDAPDKDNHLPAGHLITGIQLPANSYNKQEYVKIRDRASYAFALVSVAVAIETADNHRIMKVALAAGGVAHKPWRLREAEAFLTGKTATEDNLRLAAEKAVTGAQPLAHNGFKVALLKQALVTAVKTAMA